jgi:general secretion pathway protein E
MALTHSNPKLDIEGRNGGAGGIFAPPNHGELTRKSNMFEALFRDSLVSEGQLARLVEANEETDETPVKLIERLGFIDSTTLAAAVSLHYAIPMVSEDLWVNNVSSGGNLSVRFLRDRKVLPIRMADGGWVVATTDPEDLATIAELKVALGLPELELQIATSNQILAAIDRMQAGMKLESRGLTADASGTKVGDDEIEHLRDMALEAPVIDFVNKVFSEAAAARATDLHLEPARGRMDLRRRTDGFLTNIGTVAPEFGRAVVSRIKILCKLNIAERRLPQDGRARLLIEGREFDVRVATMPTVHGEGVALRFLSGSHEVPHIDNLGLDARDAAALKAAIQSPNGLLVVTGPTGSGKTTTLAAVLSKLNEPSRKLVTIEDPVEYQIDGVNQIQVKAEIGLTFASTLRSLLRFDPDTIMVGEMRDPETARIGLHAALTGHLVLTTLHTNSAAAAVPRLLDLGVPSYLIASTLRCVVAQRLVRKLCPHCKTPHRDVAGAAAAVFPDLCAQLKIPKKLWKAVGCNHCGGSGYHGRIAIFEALVINDNLRSLIAPTVTAGEIAGAARAAGGGSMISDGLAKCGQGLTTLEEVGRVALSE